MTTKMQHRRGTASQWSSANPVLAAGELGVVTDTARVKCGNGSSAWNDLPFLTLADGEVTTAKIADGAVTRDKLRSGTGSPEGVVTAAPGSTWLQTDATTDVKGWLRWIEATGTGNTGWVAGPEADIGWRCYATSLLNGWGYYGTARLVVRRVGQVVTVHIGDLNHTSATDPQFYTLPSGFRPTWHSTFPNYASPDSSSDSAIFIGNDGSMYYRGTLASVENAVGTYITPDAWPASLPGTAA